MVAVSPPKGREKKRKVSISLPHETFELARADMNARGFRTLSAYLEWLLLRRAEQKKWRDVVDEVFAEKPMTDEERDEADRALGLKTAD